MSFSDAYSEMKTNDKTSLFLEKGLNIVRFVSKPIKLVSVYCETPYTDKEGNQQIAKRSEPVYPNCGYEKDANGNDATSAKFVSYVIDSRDQRNEDGSVKIKMMEFGWTVLEQLAKQEQLLKAQGLPEMQFPNDKDIIISKEGEGFGTKYVVAFKFNEALNDVKVSVPEISAALAAMPSPAEWKNNLIADAMDRHSKFGKPTPKPKDAKKGVAVPTIQVDPDHQDAITGDAYAVASAPSTDADFAAV